MAVPSAVTQRKEGNTFVAESGMLVSGVTGFGIRTGFYLTNSGNYPIRTELADGANYPMIFDFPSGNSFTINPGQNKFIPFEVLFAQDNTADTPSSALSTGPDQNGKYEEYFYLTTTSDFNGQPDSEGRIRMTITGQVTGFGAGEGTGPLTSTRPAYPSGFRGVTQYGENGKPETVLRWYHPTTGYYFSRYKLEYAGNIDTVAGSSSPTGLWSGLGTFDVNYNYEAMESMSYYSPFTMKRYATNTGINQLYSRGTDGNRNSNYGEYTGQDLGFNSAYYYRIKGQYLDRNNDIDYESEYVYAYPVDNFNVSITDTDVNNGLLSGSTTLPSSSSANIKHSAGSPQAMYVYFEDGQSDINLKSAFDAELDSRGIDGSYFRAASATYAFTGVHFVVPENFTVGAKTPDTAGVTTGSRIEDDAGNELTVVLELEDNASIVGMGGAGGDGGFTDIKRPEVETYVVNRGKVQIRDRETTASTNGRSGSAAIYISATNISKFTIRTNTTAKIYGGGGGGGGGDPYFWPKAFQLRAHTDSEFDIGQTLASSVRRTNLNTADADTIIDIRGQNFSFSGRNSTSVATGFQEDYKISDILGTQLAGLGGGGQGLGISLGGASLKEGTEVKFEAQEGGFEAAGLGTPSDIGIKVSPAGNGGAWGQDGDAAVNVNAGQFFNVNLGDAEPADGGTAGEGVKVITGNGNYSSFSDLVIFKDYASPTVANYPNLLAHFSADSGVYDNDAGTNAASNGDSVHVWRSVNDASNIYLQNTSVPHLVTFSKPKFYSSSTDYTTYFNNQKVVFFDGEQDVLCLEGLVKSGKLESKMSGFEIVYFLAPFKNYTGGGVSPWSPFHRPGHNNGSFRTGKTSERHGRHSVRGWCLHQWSDIGGGGGNASQSYEKPSMFYDPTGLSREGAGLPDKQQLAFKDFTNGVNPNRAWMYSISAGTNGNNINYAVYNNLQLIEENVYPGNSYSWISKPLIGLSKSHYTTDGSCSFYGSISDIVIFKNSLTSKERRSLYNYFANSKLGIRASADKTDENDRNTVSMENGFAGFNIGPSW